MNNAPKKWFKFNVNNHVRFTADVLRIRPEGKLALSHFITEDNLHFVGTLADFMHDFGHEFRMGGPNSVFCDIELEMPALMESVEGTPINKQKETT